MTKSMVLIILTLASTGASAYFWHELRSEREVSQRLEARVAQLEKSTQPAPPPARVASLPEPVVEPEEKATPAIAARPVPPPPQAFQAVISASPMGTRANDPDIQRRMLEAQEQQRRLLQNPEYRELMRAQHRMSMGHMYGDMELLLDITPEQADQLRDLLAEQQIRRMEDEPTFVQGDMTPDPAKMRERHARAQRIQSKNDEEIAQLLGPKFSEWQSYNQNSWARSTVTSLKQTLAITDEPLRTDQIKPLVETLAREQNRLLDATRKQGLWQDPRQLDSAARLQMQQEFIERTAQTNERVRNALSGMLSPSQLEQLARQQDQQVQMQQIHLKMQRAREESQARGELPPDNNVNVFVGP